MCGIVGICGIKDSSSRLIEGLKNLEYRGYDSAGLAIIDENANIEVRRAIGKLNQLQAHIKESPLDGNIGIGHTRWATHGTATLENAHPHATERVAVVHNGIIENYRPLKEELIKQGYIFNSTTDTEVITKLLDQRLKAGESPLQAVFKTLSQLEGAYALAIIFKGHNNLLIGARHGSPLAVGIGEDEHYLGSDRLTFSHLTNKICYLEEGDIVQLTPGSMTIYTPDEKIVQRPLHQSNDVESAVSKGHFPHFMLKEIYEQPEAVQQALSHCLNDSHTQVNLKELPIDIKKVPKITIIACGTAYYAGLVAKYWFESIARIPVEIDIASEFRYRQGPMPEKGIALFISQSGETADTIAALKYAKSQNQYTIGIINVEESTLAREVDSVYYTYAGPEIGVASTKAFTTQLSVLAALTIQWGQQRGSISEDQAQQYCQSLAKLPTLFHHALQLDKEIKQICRKLKNAKDVFYLGRGSNYPIALEGALKLKELSYIHGEAYAAGEMKHGPIALIDENVPVIVLAPSNILFDKTISNMQEIISRHGQVILVSDTDQIGKSDVVQIKMPLIDELITPIIYTIPMQFLAYHTATLKGTDVDQPRNLAKSVTVE